MIRNNKKATYDRRRNPSGTCLTALFGRAAVLFAALLSVAAVLFFFDPVPAAASDSSAAGAGEAAEAPADAGDGGSAELSGEAAPSPSIYGVIGRRTPDAGYTSGGTSYTEMSGMDSDSLAESALLAGGNPADNTGGPITKDGITLEKFTIHWRTRSNDTTFSGLDFNGNPYSPRADWLMVRPASGADMTNMQWQIDFTTSGKGSIEAGDLEIVLPALIWLDRDGKEPGLLTFGIPEDPDTSQNFVWKRVGDKIIITNPRNISAAGKYMIQGTFRYTYPDPSTRYKFTTTPTYKMVDNTWSDALIAQIGITTPDNAELISMTTNELRAHVNTFVEVESATKAAQGDVYVTEELPSDLLALMRNQANGLWAYSPENPSNKNADGTNKYYYVKWIVDSKVTGTQPYTLSVEEPLRDSSGYSRVILATEVTKNGQAVLKSAGGSQSQGTVSVEVEKGVGFNKNKAAYVWMAYPASQFNDPDPYKQYTLSNRATVVAEGDDYASKREADSYSRKNVDGSVIFRKPITWTVRKEYDYNGYAPTAAKKKVIEERIAEAYRKEYEKGLTFWIEDQSLTYYSHSYRNPQNVHSDLMTAEDYLAAEASGVPWQTQWTDNGKITSFRPYEDCESVTNSSHAKGNGVSYHIMGGTIETVELSTGGTYTRSWWIDHQSTKYDAATHTWTFYNDYHEGSILTYPSDAIKRAYRKGNDWWDEKSLLDRDLFLLHTDRDTSDITYSLSTTQFLLDLTAKGRYLGNAAAYNRDPEYFRAHPVKLRLSETDQYFEGKKLNEEDYYISSVRLSNPTVKDWVPSGENYELLGVESGSFVKTDPVPVEVSVRGDNGVWTKVAELADGTVTVTPAGEAMGVTAQGLIVHFPDDTVRKVMAEATTKNAILTLSYSPSIRLCPTDRVKAIVKELFMKSDYAHAVHTNYAFVEYYEIDNNNKHYPVTEITDRSPLHGRINRLAVTLDKTSTYTDYDLSEHYLRFHNTMTLTQQSNMSNRDEFLEAVDEGFLPVSGSGTFYDLLPPGMRVDESTIKADSNLAIQDIAVFDNYRGSGSQLLVIRAALGDDLYARRYVRNQPRQNDPTYPNLSQNQSAYSLYGYRHAISFDMLYSVEEFFSRGISSARNHAAYEADEAEFGNSGAWLNGEYKYYWAGEADAPTGTNHKESLSQVSNDAKPLLTDLDSGRDDPVFVYAGANLKASEIDLWAQTHLTKYVSLAGAGDWHHGKPQFEGDEVDVLEGTTYTYRLGITTGTSSVTDEIIMLDKLESFVPDAGDYPEYWSWRGSLVSVDVSEIRQRGVDPVVWYTTKDIDLSLYVSEPTDDHSVPKKLSGMLDSGGDGWTTTPPEDMSSVRAIAIDCRKDADGNRFELQEYETLMAYINMRAPHYADHKDIFSETDYNNPENNAHAFNNVWMEFRDRTVGVPVSQGTYGYQRHDYTVVGIYSGILRVKKEWDDEDDNDGIRPEAVAIRLLANGGESGKEPLILCEENNWQGEFHHVSKYDEQGRSITYSFGESAVEKNASAADHADLSERYTILDEPVSGYKMSWEREADDITVTNRHVPELTEVPFEKIWDTYDDEDGWERNIPQSIHVQLYAQYGEGTAPVSTGRSQTLRTFDYEPEVTGEGTEGDDRRRTIYRNRGTFTDLRKYYDHGKTVVYSVRESAITNFITKYEDGNTIRNIYYPLGNLVVKKVTTGATEAAENTVFTFTLKLLNKDGVTQHQGRYHYVICDTSGAVEGAAEGTDEFYGTPLSEGVIENGDTFELQQGQCLVVKEIPTKVQYTVTEAKNPGWTLSRSVRTKGAIASGDNNAEFRNTYHSTGMVNLVGDKTLYGRCRMLRSQFTFGLYDEEGNLLRTTSNASVRNDEAAEGAGRYGNPNIVTADLAFGSLSYTEKDDGKIFTYYIREIDDGAPGYQYDETEYRVRVFPVDDGEGTLNVTAVYYKKDSGGRWVTADDSDSPEFHFENRYEATGEVRLSAWKTLKNGGLADYELAEYLANRGGFSFDLIQVASLRSALNFLDNPYFNEIPTVQYVVLTPEDNGKVSFDPIPFTQDDAGKHFYYVVRENYYGDRDVNYDRTVFVYAVSVYDNGDGTLSFSTITYEVNDELKEKVEANELTEEPVPESDFVPAEGTLPNFVNTLKKGTLTVKKELTGSGYSNRTFRFRVRLISEDFDDEYINIRVPESDPGLPGSDEGYPYYEDFYWISFDAGEGHGNMETRRIRTSSPFELPKNLFLRLGHTFSRWIFGEGSTKMTPEGGFADQEVIPADTYERGDHIILTPVWEEKEKETGTTVQEFEFDMEGWQTATFENLPAGTRFQVWEEEPGGGWVLIQTDLVESSQGPTGGNHISENTSGQIKPNTWSNTIFLNEYNTNKASISLTGTKTLNGDAEDAEGFAFELLEDISRGSAPIDTAVVHGGVFGFKPIVYNNSDAGTYWYTIREAVPAKNSDEYDETITYDTHWEKVQVIVEDNGEGVLTARIGERELYRASYDDNMQIVYDGEGNPVLEKISTEGGESPMLSFANVQDKPDPGILRISKSAKDHVISRDQFDWFGKQNTKDQTLFDFEVSLTKDGGVPARAEDYLSHLKIVRTDTEEEITDPEGAADYRDARVSISASSPDRMTVKLAVGETAVLDGLPVGTGYTVREAGIPRGWQLAEEKGSSTGEITADKAEFKYEAVNVYEAEGYAALEAHKKLAGDELRSGEFEFGVWESLDDCMNLDVSAESFVTSARNHDVDTEDETAGEGDEASENPWKGYAPVHFGEISYTTEDIGRHVYYIREIVPAAGSASYDEKILYSEAVVKAEVTVEDDGEGYLAVQVLYYDAVTDQNGAVIGWTQRADSLAGEAMFVNTVRADELLISKTAEGATEASKDTRFAFVLTVKDAAGEPLDGEYSYRYTVSAGNTSEGNAGGGDTAVHPLTFEDGKATVYLRDGEALAVSGLPVGAEYEITEVEAPGWTLIKKSGESGTIASTPGDSEEPVNKASFKNRYNTEGNVELPFRKTLKGGTLEKDDFSFVLTDAKGKVVQRAKNDGEGNVSFLLNFTQKDDGSTFNYYVSEVAGDAALIKYDSRTFRITVSVNDNGEGTLVPTITSVVLSGEGENRLEEEADPEKDWVFRNEYLDGICTFTIKKTGFRTVRREQDGTVHETKERVPLTGAEFELWRMNAGGNYEIIREDIRITDTEGLVMLEDMPEGDYKLVEIVAPENYLILQGPIYFRMRLEDKEGKAAYRSEEYYLLPPERFRTVLTLTNGVVKEDGEPESILPSDDPELLKMVNDSDTLEVINIWGVELPLTGGPGTKYWMPAGWLMMLAAAGLLIAGRRKRSRR